MPRSRISGSYGNSIFNFLRNHIQSVVDLCSFKANSKYATIKGRDYTKLWAPGAGTHRGPIRSCPLFLISKSRPQFQLEISIKHSKHAKHISRYFLNSMSLKWVVTL